MKLIIGNKNYSSWSMRAWLALKCFDFYFEEVCVSLFSEGYKDELRTYSSSARVPVLIDGQTAIYDSLAICEYLAEMNRSMWPEESEMRAHARSVAAEMHSGFFAIRDSLPMNCRVRKKIDVTAMGDVQQDITRVFEIWNECLSESNGPFLFGRFSLADVLYAPVVSRFDSYSIIGDDTVEKYRREIKKLKPYQQWHAAAAAESESIRVVDNLDGVSLR